VLKADASVQFQQRDVEAVLDVAEFGMKDDLSYFSSDDCLLIQASDSKAKLEALKGWRP
jgi:hypothetical protein